MNLTAVTAGVRTWLQVVDMMARGSGPLVVQGTGLSKVGHGEVWAVAREVLSMVETQASVRTCVRAVASAVRGATKVHRPPVVAMGRPAQGWAAERFVGLGMWCPARPSKVVSPSTE